MNKWSKTDYPNRKAWESPYGGAPPKKGGDDSYYVNINNLPAKKFCLLAYKVLEPGIDAKQFLNAWMKEHGVKGRWAGVYLDDQGHYRDVFTFKRTSDTVRFKLTWG